MELHQKLKEEAEEAGESSPDDDEGQTNSLSTAGMKPRLIIFAIIALMVAFFMSFILN